MIYNQYLEKEKQLCILEGLLLGVACDQQINQKELELIANWCGENNYARKSHPFNDIYPILERAIDTKSIPEEDQQGIVWVIRNLFGNNPFKESLTRRIQILQGIIFGVLSDGVITVEEMRAIRKWIDANRDIASIFPVSEIETQIYKVLQDGKIDKEEHKEMLLFFESIVPQGFIDNSSAEIIDKVSGLCAIDPEILFKSKGFCITGEFKAGPRSQIENEIKSRGGIIKSGVSRKVDYLVVGSDGSESWAFNCYGLKVQRAMDIRKAGHPIVIVHEFDFNDALQS